MTTVKVFTSIRTMPNGEMFPAKELFDIYFPEYIKVNNNRNLASFLEWFNDTIAFEDYCKYYDI